MHVAGLQAEAEHGREMADGVAGVGVQHQFGARGRAGGEIEQQRIVGAGRTFRREIGGGLLQLGEIAPAGRRAAHGDADDLGGEIGEAVGGRAFGDDEAGAASGDAVGDVGGGEQRRGGDDDDAELHRRQQRNPESGRVADHEQQPVAALGAERTQRVGGAVGGLREFAEAQGFDLGAQNLERRLPGVLALGEFGVEPVERPVEALELGPLKAGAREFVVVAQREQQVARGFERRCRHVRFARSRPCRGRRRDGRRSQRPPPSA